MDQLMLVVEISEFRDFAFIVHCLGEFFYFSVMHRTET